MMKLRAEEWAEIDRIKHRYSEPVPGLMQIHIEMLISYLEKLRPKSRERFTYKIRDCLNCDGSGNVSAAMSSIDCDVENCPACGGLGKVRTKVKSKAHNA